MTNSKLGICFCCLATFVYGKSSLADPSVIMTSGNWSSYADITGVEEKSCSTATDVGGGVFSLSGRSTEPNKLRVTLHKDAWNIPDLAVPITVEFDNGNSVDFIGIGKGAFIRADIPIDQVKPFIHRFTLETQMTVRLPQGKEQPWVTSLKGTTPTVRSMALCLQTAGIPLPPPFIQTKITDDTSHALNVPTLALQTSKTTSPTENNHENDFRLAVERSKADYTGAANDFTKGATRVQRKNSICSILTQLRISGWHGTIKELSSSSSGKGVLTIDIGGGIVVGTTNNSFSDSFQHTLIDASAPFYAALAAMSVGTRVVFSGDFFSSEDDCVREESLTQEGSMTEPEFLFHFSEVGLEPVAR